MCFVDEAGFFCNTGAACGGKFVGQAIDLYDSNTTPALIYKINQLEAMQLTNSAWHKVDTTTIWNCWQKAGILPKVNHTAKSTIPSVPISSLLNSESSDALSLAEKEVLSFLDPLKVCGILKQRNWMDIEELLNPLSKQKLVGTLGTVGSVSENEIFKSVQGKIEAEQLMEVNGGDNIDDLTVAKLTHKEALSAAFTLQIYIADINDPFAHKLEGLLASFGWQTRLEEVHTMETTYITNYFAQN